MLKSQFRSVLFAALVPFAACGESTPAPTVSLPMIESTPVPPPVTVLDPVTPPTTEEAKVDPIKLEETQPIPTKFGEAMTLGKELAGKGDHARAREMFEAAVVLDKTKASPHVELARVFIASGERGLAVAAARRAVKLAPESSQAWNTMGRAELARHDYDKAVLAFRQATELDPTNAWAWNNLGLVHLTHKRYAEAVDALVQATAGKAAESYMFNNLGTAYEQLDQLDEARTAFARGAELGSVAAASSRKRLDGVRTIAIVTKPKVEKVAKPRGLESSYDINDEMPPVVDESKDQAAPDDTTPDLPIVDEPAPAPVQGEGSAAGVPTI
ncbi:MAG: tetratricopeptide repeat protein [Deltaproteobacteria bacterium]|nr:tetratricopeptide repeat protein [Deltaproteobacteria bacterium]